MTRVPRLFNGECPVFSINGARKIGYSHIQKDEIGPLSTSNTKINSEQIKDLTLRAKTIYVLEENIRENLHDIELGSDF